MRSDFNQKLLRFDFISINCNWFVFQIVLACCLALSFAIEADFDNKASEPNWNADDASSPKSYVNAGHKYQYEGGMCLPGHPGPSGPPGPRGTSGMPGYNGAPGKAGLPGKDGADGVPGRDGTPGKKGAKGAKGDTGPTGSVGVPGLPGLPGSPGAPANGQETCAYGYC